MFYKVLFMLVFAGVSASSAGPVHVCTDADGNKTFQQMPCEAGAKAELKEYKPAMVGTVAPTAGGSYQDMHRFNSKEQLKRDVRKSENRIVQYQQYMQAELAALQNKKRSANNNLAGAQWENSISSEMQAVTTKYNGFIATEQNRLDAQRKQLESLN